MRPLSRLAALSVLLLNACYPAGDGKPPPLEELYFPTGLAIDAQSVGEQGAPKYMYVANSDFDLQYRAGSVVSYDLDKLRGIVPKNCTTGADCPSTICDSDIDDPSHVPTYYCVDDVTEPCGALGERGEADRVLYPGRCNPIDPIAQGVLVDSVGIGAFATDVLWRPNPNLGSMYPSRLFVPVRGDSSLHWIDVRADGTFYCGQNGTEDGACDESHRSGDNTSDNIDHLRQPAEPYALDATADGAFVVVTNQTTGTVSLFANDWRSDAGPTLVSILSGLPLAPVGIAVLPETMLASDVELEPGFLVAYSSAAQIDLLRVHTADTKVNEPGTADYTRYSLRRGGSVPINANSLGFDSRGIAIDGDARQKEYDACTGGAASCPDAMTPAGAKCRACIDAVHVRPEVYVASRAPASLLVGAMTADVNYPAGTNPLPSFTDPIPLTFGPSRVILGDVRVPGNTFLDPDGKPYALERRVFVVCFDSRRIFMYDPKRRALDAIVSTGRGPYALAVDSARGLAYLGHFTDSYLGVVSLDQRFPQTYATIVASIGIPKTPRTSK